MAKPKKEKEEKVVLDEVIEPNSHTEKERLLELYDTLKALNVRSIGDLENLIARAE